MGKLLKKLISIILIIGIVLADSSTLVEAKTDIMFKNITIEEGLSQATVETIYQDSKGYMWFGTNDGLNRYNGYDFKVYRNEIGSKLSLTSNYIMKIVEDKNSNLWVVTLNGLNKLNSDRSEVTQYLDSDESGNLSSNKLSDILITKDGKILISSYKGIDVYNEKEDKFEPFIKNIESLKHESVYALDEDSKGNIWIGNQLGLDIVDANGEIKKSFIIFTIVCTTLVSKYFYPLHLAKFPPCHLLFAPETDEAIYQQFPAQHFFMFSGITISHENYLIFASIILSVCSVFLLLKHQLKFRVNLEGEQKI